MRPSRTSLGLAVNRSVSCVGVRVRTLGSVVAAHGFACARWGADVRVSREGARLRVRALGCERRVQSWRRTASRARVGVRT